MTERRQRNLSAAMGAKFEELELVRSVLAARIAGFDSATEVKQFELAHRLLSDIGNERKNRLQALRICTWLALSIAGVIVAAGKYLL